MLRIASVAAIVMTITAGQALATPRPVADFGPTARPENVRCHGRNCRVNVYGHRYGYRSHGYRAQRWHSQNPADMRVGSRRWWNAKDREGSTGRP